MFEPIWNWIARHIDPTFDQHPWWHVLGIIIQIILLFIVARLVIKVATRTVARFLRLRTVRIDERRKDTLESLLDNVVRYTVYFIWIIISLQTMQFHVETLLAGAGIAGLALGFGAQSLIKDILTGLFILFEDQYGVGDVVKINNFNGTVISIGLRLTRIQAWTGEIEIIPNGQITQVTNFSRANSLAVVEVGVSYSADLDKAQTIMRDVMEAIGRQSSDVVGDIQVQGVQQLRDANILLRATAVCKPTQQYGVQRAAQQRIKEAFDAAGIEIGIPQTVVHLFQEEHAETRRSSPATDN